MCQYARRKTSEEASSTIALPYYPERFAHPTRIADLRVVGCAAGLQERLGDIERGGDGRGDRARGATRDDMLEGVVVVFWVDICLEVVVHGKLHSREGDIHHQCRWVCHVECAETLASVNRACAGSHRAEFRVVDLHTLFDD